jgi:tRNA A-37 threonylcarbamoyl transferase component Bud32
MNPLVSASAGLVAVTAASLTQAQMMEVLSLIPLAKSYLEQEEENLQQSLTNLEQSIVSLHSEKEKTVIQLAATVHGLEVIEEIARQMDRIRESFRQEQEGFREVKWQD